MTPSDTDAQIAAFWDAVDTGLTDETITVMYGSDSDYDFNTKRAAWGQWHAACAALKAIDPHLCLFLDRDTTPMGLQITGQPKDPFTDKTVQALLRVTGGVVPTNPPPYMRRKISQVLHAVKVVNDACAATTEVVVAAAPPTVTDRFVLQSPSIKVKSKRRLTIV